jgi:hypothetical protein
LTKPIGKAGAGNRCAKPDGELVHAGDAAGGYYYPIADGHSRHDEADERPLAPYSNAADPFHIFAPFDVFAAESCPLRGARYGGSGRSDLVDPEKNLADFGIGEGFQWEMAGPASWADAGRFHARRGTPSALFR